MHNASRTISSWRNDASSNSPAGPLFISGPFAEADIASEVNTITAGALCNSGRCGTACSGSAGHPCC